MYGETSNPILQKTQIYPRKNLKSGVNPASVKNGCKQSCHYGYYLIPGPSLHDIFGNLSHGLYQKNGANRIRKMNHIAGSFEKFVICS